MDKIEAVESRMSFTLKDGNTVYIEKDDVRNIATKINEYILSNELGRVYMLQDTSYKRAMQLYEVFKAEKRGMTKTIKEKCLNKIVEYLANDKYELTTLKEFLADNKPK